MSLTYPLLGSANIHQMLLWVNNRYGRDQGSHELLMTKEHIDLDMSTDDIDSLQYHQDVHVRHSQGSMQQLWLDLMLWLKMLSLRKVVAICFPFLDL